MLSKQIYMALQTRRGHRTAAPASLHAALAIACMRSHENHLLTLSSPREVVHVGKVLHNRADGIAINALLLHQQVGELFQADAVCAQR